MQPVDPELWVPGEPNQGIRNNCMFLRKDDQYGLTDVPCCGYTGAFPLCQIMW